MSGPSRLGVNEWRENEKRIHHRRSPKTGDRVRDDKLKKWTVRKWRSREKNLLALAMSRAICARNSSGPLNFFSSRRRSQNLTSMRLGVEVNVAPGFR